MTTRMNIRILIVDDEIGFADVLRKRMARRGVEATPVSSGEEAVRTLRGSEFDVAIVDLKLQGMDGVEILRVFRLMAPEMPVLMLTGHGCDDARKLCMEHGAVGYLHKPVEFDHLLERTLLAAGTGGAA